MPYKGVLYILADDSAGLAAMPPNCLWLAGDSAGLTAMPLNCLWLAGESAGGAADRSGSFSSYGGVAVPCGSTALPDEARFAVFLLPVTAGCQRLRNAKKVLLFSEKHLISEKQCDIMAKSPMSRRRPTDGYGEMAELV